VANGSQVVSYLKKLPFLLLCGTPLLAFIAFSDSKLYWVNDAYDGWRIFQIILLMMLGFYAVFMRVNRTSFSQQTNQTLRMVLPVLYGLVITSAWQAEHSARAAVDAALYALLAISVWAQADFFRKNPTVAPHIAAMLAILPIFVVMTFLTGLYQAIHGNGEYDWHQSFANIRMLDDALLPCLFLLWQRPAWLAKNTFKNNLINITITTSIYVISTAYLLILCYDGARAVLISILIGLGFIALFRSDTRSNLRLPIFTLFSAGILFSALKQLIIPDFLANPILRTGSSGRDGLWIKALELWQEHPLLGVGGNNFVTSEPWLLNGHPHNLPLQWISEWGVAGLLAMLLLVPLAVQCYRHRRIMPAFALSAVVSVGVDALFSGVLDYPLSQMLGIWSLAWLVSVLPTHSLNSNVYAVNNNRALPTSKITWLSWQHTLKIIALTAILTLLFVHGRDLICHDCRSLDNDNAPRFWQYGRALHLVPNSSEAINSSPEALLNNR
jgi:O-antigen ligase